MGEFIRNINWELLKKQKETLLKLREDKILNESDRDDLEGVVNLIDGVQDWAVDDQGVAEELVFPDGQAEAYNQGIAIDEINSIVEKYGEFSVADVDADHSPYVDANGELSHLMERFREHQGTVYVYDLSSHSSDELDEYDEDYYNLSNSQLEYVLELARKFKEINEE